MNEEAGRSTATLVTALESPKNSASVLAVTSAMLAMHSMIEDVHDAIDSEQELAVRVKPFQQGGFEIVLELAAITLPLIQGSGLLDWILLVAEEFFDVKRRLGGQKYHIQGDNNIIFADTTIHLHPQTARLLSPGNRANKCFQEAFRQIEREKEIEAFRVRQAGAVEPLANILRKEFGSFRIPAGIVEKVKSREYILRDVTLRIRSAAFDKNLQWRFMLDGKPISARLEDVDFLVRVRSGEKFASGDTVIVDLLVKQEWDWESNGLIDREYVVLTVHEHHARKSEEEQPDLFS